ncbi:MAG: ROK family protein [Prevotella sp.]|nr:ROK family protein [Prevotella sp.]
MEEDVIKSRVVGVDISNERTTYAIVDIRGNIIAEDGFPTSEYPDISEFVTKLSESMVALMEANGGFMSVRSVGISCPSADSLTGSIVNAPNLPWKGVVPLAAMLRDRMGMAVALGNDAHVAALGEYSYGIAHGMNDFVVVSIGIGLGSSFFSHGRGHKGFRGFSGEVGHACIVDHGRKCGCGKEGCLEAYCGAKGIVQTAREVMAESNVPSLMSQQERLSPRTIAACCEQGDEQAIEVYRRTGYMLGIGLANYASIVDPQAIILTGGISHAGKWLLEPLRKSFDEHVFQNMRGDIKIIVSRLNDHEREVLGSSALAWEVPEYSLFK